MNISTEIKDQKYHFSFIKLYHCAKEEIHKWTVVTQGH